MYILQAKILCDLFYIDSTVKNSRNVNNFPLYVFLILKRRGKAFTVNSITDLYRRSPQIQKKISTYH